MKTEASESFDSKMFKLELQKVQENINKREEHIMSVKKDKFQRATYDYAHNQVYEWDRLESHSQMRCNKHMPVCRVSFCSSEFDSYDNSLDISNNNMT